MKEAAKRIDARSVGSQLSESIIYHFPDPILIHSNGKILYGNKIVLEATGMNSRTIVGRGLKNIFADPLDPTQQLLVDRHFSDMDPGEEEVEIRTSNRRVLIKVYLLHNTKIKFKGKDAIMTVMRDITERKQMERVLVRKVIETEEKDRKQFAIDLHDDLGPVLSSIKIHLGMLNPSADPAQFCKDHNQCKLLLNAAIAKMRIIANNLMPRLIDSFGLESALRSLIAGVSREGVFEVKMTSNLLDRRLPRHTELQLYRVISELLNNTLKHSGATLAQLKIHLNGSSLKISYSDNGKGYDFDLLRKTAKGMGLANIEHRMFLIDGTIAFFSRLGKTYVSIKLNV